MDKEKLFNIRQQIGGDPFRAMAEAKVNTYNQSRVDDGTGIQCEICNNRGSVAFLNDEGFFTIRPCKCAGTRLTVQRLQKQGLFDIAKEKTLPSFRTDTDTQRALKSLAVRYVKEQEPRWMILCGQSGSGKTHLCTAAFVRITLDRGLDGRYLLWNSDGRRIKAAAKEGDERLLNDFKGCALLYIDDLFKCKRDSEPSDADVRLAFEILDYRYNHKLMTIISTEMLLEDEFDKLMNGSKPPHDSEELIFSLTFYLAAFKKYLDNWETHLKRTFGKGSREVNLFKSAQSYEYDNHIEYRIFYRLRNYDQHCDNLVSRITGRILPNESHEYLVLADRDRLLNDFDKWKPEEIAYLQSCDKYFGIRPLLNIFQNCIISIHEKIMQIHFNQEFFCSCATIVAAAKEFENEDTVHFIGVENEIDWTNLDLEGNPFNFTYLEVPICKHLLEVYFLNNRKSVKIFYHGASLKQRLDSR